MTIAKSLKNDVQNLKDEFDRLRLGKESLLQILEETEIPELVYNSNAIENSTLTLKETEDILLEMEVSKKLSVRDVFEAKNLARIVEYLHTHFENIELDIDSMMFFHQMLIGNIDDKIAGRFRQNDEYVRVGTYIAPGPEDIKRIVKEILNEYKSSNTYFLEKIAKFHMDFENIHPFVDGNGRLGRVFINFHLQKLGYPNVVLRDKEKHIYYKAFGAYRDTKNTKPMEKILVLALMESLHKRIAYLKGLKIVNFSDYTKQNSSRSVRTLLNSAKRQTIPAFREKGIWKIGV